MKKQLIYTQLSNFKTCYMYYKRLMEIAENVFIFQNLPDFIDEGYFNKQLITKGSVVFFKDEVLNQFLILPYAILSGLDVYGRPKVVQAIGQNGYTKTLKKGEFVIIYDNINRTSIYDTILQFAIRLGDCVRTRDVNRSQLKTPRIWKVPQDKVASFKALINEIEANNEKVLTYSDSDWLNIEEVSSTLAPVPILLSELNDEQNNIFNEFLSFLGVSNLTINKRERLIRDEVQTSQGGTLVSKYARFKSRKKAADEINKKFGLNLDVVYYENIDFLKGDFIDEEGDTLWRFSSQIITTYPLLYFQF